MSLQAEDPSVDIDQQLEGLALAYEETTLNCKAWKQALGSNSVFVVRETHASDGPSDPQFNPSNEGEPSVLWLARSFLDIASNLLSPDHDWTLTPNWDAIYYAAGVALAGEAFENSLTLEVALANIKVLEIGLAMVSPEHVAFGTGIDILVTGTDTDEPYFNPVPIPEAKLGTICCTTAFSSVLLEHVATQRLLGVEGFARERLMYDCGIGRRGLTRNHQQMCDDAGDSGEAKRRLPIFLHGYAWISKDAAKNYRPPMIFMADIASLYSEVERDYSIAEFKSLSLDVMDAIRTSVEDVRAFDPSDEMEDQRCLEARNCLPHFDPTSTRTAPSGTFFYLPVFLHLFEVLDGLGLSNPDERGSEADGQEGVGKVGRQDELGEESKQELGCESANAGKAECERWTSGREGLDAMTPERHVSDVHGHNAVCIEPGTTLIEPNDPCQRALVALAEASEMLSNMPNDALDWTGLYYLAGLAFAMGGLSGKMVQDLAGLHVLTLEVVRLNHRTLLEGLDIAKLGLGLSSGPIRVKPTDKDGMPVVSTTIGGDGPVRTIYLTPDFLRVLALHLRGLDQTKGRGSFDLAQMAWESIYYECGIEAARIREIEIWFDRGEDGWTRTFKP